MKKSILFLAAILLLSVSSFAQAGFRLGIKGGANLNQVSGVSFSDAYALSYHVGVFTEIDFNKRLGLQPEVLWNQSSTTVASGFASIYQSVAALNVQDARVTLNYLSIPILLRYNVGKLVTLNAGPQFGILMNQDQTLLKNGTNAFSNGDFSMVGGLQFNLKLLRIYGRYNIGMKNINQIDQKDKWTSQQIQVGVGLRL